MLQGFCRLVFVLFNMGLTLGLMILALLMLRPLLVRLLSPGHRVAVWGLVWMFFYQPSIYTMTNNFSILPVTLRSLITPRGDGTPAYFPNWYTEPGPYNLAFPGGGVLRVDIAGWFPVLLGIFWLTGVVLFCWYDWHSTKKLLAVASKGEEIFPDDPLRRGSEPLWRKDVLVRRCENLPSSFVVRGSESRRRKCAYAIYIQAELPPEQLQLVLLHEGEHIRLFHCIVKGYASVALAIYWWNPLVWWGYHVFCRDIELACDRSVLERLESDRQRDYARALVELGSGRQLWESPLSFGECDAARRVKAVVAWARRPTGQLRRGLSWVVTVFLFLFLMGGPMGMDIPQDISAAFQRETGSTESLLLHVESQLQEELKDPDLRIEQLWYQKERVKVLLAWTETPQTNLFILTSDGRWYRQRFIWLDNHPTYLYLTRNRTRLGRPPELTGCYQFY